MIHCRSLRNTPLQGFAMICILTLAQTSTAGDILSVHCPLGCLSNPVDNDQVFGYITALSNNPTTKFADWVAYEVDVLNFGPSPGRIWASDPLLDDSDTLETGDYTGASTRVLNADRGHQAPLAAFAGSHYWDELNYLSNITPQHKDLNRGAWKKLEMVVRSAVEFRRNLFVIIGPIFETTMATLPGADETHSVPSGYFKIVYNRQGEDAFFVMDQSFAKTTSFCSTVTDAAGVQSKVGFALPAITEDTTMVRRLGCLD